MAEWLILVLLVPAIVVPVVALVGFAGCKFQGQGTTPPPIIDSVTIKSPGVITVTWEYHFPYFQHFHFVRTNPDGSTTPLDDKSPPPFSFDDTVDERHLGLGPYTYKVQGVSEDGSRSDFSPPVSVRFIDAPVFLGSSITGPPQSASLSTTTINDAPAGSVIVVGTMCGNGSTVSSVTDGINTYTRINEIANGPTVVGLWYTATPLASLLPRGTTVTVNFSAGRSEAAIVVCYITGLIKNSKDIFAYAATTAATTTQSISTGPLAQANEIVIGWLASFDNAPSYTPGAGFTKIASFGVDQTTVDFEYKIVSSTDPVTWNPTTSSPLSAGGVIEVASFKGM